MKNINAAYVKLLRTSTHPDIFGNRPRWLYRDCVSEELRTKHLSTISENRKQIHKTYRISKPIDDPFVISKFENKTEIQELVVKHSRYLSVFGNFAYSCSCGSGKTIAGLYIIHKLKCKTLIVSSRNAVNDQWKSIISNMYPELNIHTGKDSNQYADIYIYTPQYLCKHPSLFLGVGLIIYDEIHSLTGPEFSTVMMMPIMWGLRKIDSEKNIYHEIPYMIGLSATFPTGKTGELLGKLFGAKYSAKSSIVDIPIHVWDYRLHAGDRGNYDQYYSPFSSEYESIRFLDEKMNQDEIVTVCRTYKGIIMTDTISSSIYAALYMHHKYKQGVLIIRAHSEPSVYLPGDKYLDYIFDEQITLQDIIRDKIGIRTKLYQKYIEDCSIICGTLSRLTEGFSVQNITWGICTKFIYSTSRRIQMLGRCRRCSDDEELNKQKRIFYVSSGKAPTNLFSTSRLRGRIPIKITYDFDYEKSLFEKENYIMI